jgi:hypothetical protein
LYSFEEIKDILVTRAKRNLKYEVIGQHEVDEKKGLL